MDQKLSVSGILQDAWKQFSGNISYIYYLLAPMFVCSLLGILLYPEFLYFNGGSQVNIAKTLPSIILSILGFIVGLFSTISLLFFFRSGKKDTWNTWKSYFRLLPKYIWVCILQGLMILAGLILLVIPGIYLAVRYAFVSYRTLENPTKSVTELFKEEAQATEGNRSTILFIGLLLLLIALVLAGIFNALFPNFMTSGGNPVADFLFELIVTPFFTVVSILTYLKLTTPQEGTPVVNEAIETKKEETVEENVATPEPVV